MFNFNPNLTYRYQRTRIIRCKHQTSCAFTITVESLLNQKISFSQLCWFPSRNTSFSNITFL